MRLATIVIIVLLFVLIAFTYIAPSIYRECVSPDGNFSTLQVTTYKLSRSIMIDSIAFILGALLSACLFVLAFRKRNMSTVLRFSALLVTGTIALIFITLGILLSVSHGLTGYGPDQIRNSFTGAARAHLQVFYDVNGHYPVSLLDAIPDMLKKTAFDPVTRKPYGYAASADGQSYVLSATFGVKKDSNCLEPVSSLQRLNDDLDGNVFGLDCDDPIYCVGYSMKDGELVRIK